MIPEAESVLREDPIMAGLIDTHTLYTEAEWAAYERLCISIINQQLSTASAKAVRTRTFDLLGEVTPETVLRADESALREAGLSASKVKYLQNAARAFQKNDYTKAGLADYTDDEVLNLLTEIKGIGEWTANMYLLFVLERPDVLPLGDLAIRRGIESLYGNGESMTRTEMREIAEPWRPYRSVATRYIWASYESE